MQNKAKKSISQKRVHYNGINIFNKLPNNNKQLKELKSNSEWNKLKFCFVISDRLSNLQENKQIVNNIAEAEENSSCTNHDLFNTVDS